jgi:hypothetical protein
MKELIDMYSGPDVVTAKQQEGELQRVANTLPENIPSSVKRFTDKTLLSLKVCVIYNLCSEQYICGSGVSILCVLILSNLTPDSPLLMRQTQFMSNLAV